ncbi:hypothetical protein BDY19DRAFT_997738 [Irpex rosettiformis]|uniref:Uncharacterized protein n=1 Tax=Irpex rosettiformis TaxID=378272 RepID=A0ACB8TQY0_9APHY|nr:hypothetical protein BDY19DRAFT_997738 [Irpex rosettiformis]
MSLTVENPIVLDLTSTFGAMIIGSALSFAIWGIICMQAYVSAFLYYANYPNDRLFLKLLVFVLWGMDTARLVLEFTALWTPLISRWGSVAAIQSNLPIMLHSDWIGATAIIIVQFFFLWRIYRLGGYRTWKWVVIAFVVLAGLFQFCKKISSSPLITLSDDPISILQPSQFVSNPPRSARSYLLHANEHQLQAFDIIGLRGSTLSTENSPILKNLQLADRTCTAAIDVIICVSLVKLLLQNGVPVYSRTRQLLYRGVVVTINTGLWTAILSIVDLVLMGAQPNNFYYCIIELPIQSLYVVTLISNLSARSYVRGKLTEWDEYLTTLPEEFQLPKDSKLPVGVGYVLATNLSGSTRPGHHDDTKLTAMTNSSVVTTEITFAQPGTVEYR